MVKKVLLPAGNADTCGASSAFTDLSALESAHFLTLSLKLTFG